MVVGFRTKNLFHKFLSINLMLLNAGGTLNDRNSLKNPAGLITLAILFVWTIGAWCKIIIYAKGNKNIAIQIVGSVFSAYLATTKGLSLIFKSKNIREILQRLSVMWDEQYKVVKNRNVMLTTAKNAYRITLFCFIVCLLVSFVFHLNPYKNLLYQYLWTKNENNTYNLTTIIPTEYPVDVNYIGNYVPIIIMEHAITTFFLIYLTSSDTLFCQLLTHLCLHFEFLRYDLENIIKSVIPLSVSNEEKREALQKLSKIVERHNELYALSRRVEKIFRSIFFVSMLVTSISICMSLHQLQGLIVVGQFWEGLAQLSHGIILLCEVAIYCGFSSMLSHETELVAIAAYNCPWPYLGKQFCYKLQFLMLRAQKNFRCRAYGFFRIDLPQFTTIISTATTYFTLLNSLEKQK